MNREPGRGDPCLSAPAAAVDRTTHLQQPGGSGARPYGQSPPPTKGPKLPADVPGREGESI